MKILAQDRKKGAFKLKVENLDDLWHLSHVVQPGDVVTKHTVRKVKLDFEGRTEVEKKSMTLALEVDRVEFHEFSSALRISGEIREGPEDISGHHTFSVEPHDTLVVTKNWTAVDLERIRSSKETPKAMLCAADRESAVFATLRPNGFRLEFTLNSHLPRKDDPSYETALSQYYGEVAAKLREFEGTRIIGGPGFVKDHIAKLAGARVISSSSATKSGIREMMESEALENILGESRTRKESVAVEELLKRIAKDGAYAYGFDATKKAAEMGAVELVLVSEQSILDRRREGTYKELDKLLETVEKQRGEIMLVSSEGEHGRKLSALGGVAALLRYKVE